MILYSFRRCPYAMRARMALYYSGVQAELREVVLREKPQAMLDASPKGTVPVLILDDGRVIEESLDIMHWTLKQNDPDDWYRPAIKEETDSLIAENDGPFKKALDRYKYPNRYPKEDCSGAKDACLAFFEKLETRLKKNGYLIMDRLTLADIAIFPFIRQCAHVDKSDFDSLKLPNLQSWLEARKQSALFNAVMKKYKQWQDGDEPVIFRSAS